MSSLYPGALDDLSPAGKQNTTPLTDDHPAHHNLLADALEKVENELGADPSGAYATVAARLAALPTSAIPPTIFDALGDLLIGAGNDQYGRLPPGTAGQILTMISGAPGWAAAPASGIQPTLVDAKGDLIGASADNTPARVPVGADGQVLIADSSQASGVRWGTPKPNPEVISLRNPYSGNPYTVPYVVQLSVWEYWSWLMYAKQDGYLYGLVRVPPGCTSAAAIEVAWTAGATGNVVLAIQQFQVAAGGSINPGAYGAGLGAKTLTVGAAWASMQTQWALGFTPTAGSLLQVRIDHNGTSGADTMSGGHVYVHGAWLIP